MLSSIATSTDPLLLLGGGCILAASFKPPSKGPVVDTSERSRTRKEGSAAAEALSKLSAVDFRLPKATENLGI